VKRAVKKVEKEVKGKSDQIAEKVDSIKNKIS